MGLSGVLSVGAVVGGRYRVEELFPDREGAMSIVARARRLDTGEAVAIKALHPELAGDAELVERFRREARALALLRNEHVVRVHEVYEPKPGEPCMVMELLRGEDLDQVLEEEGPLELHDAVAAIDHACDGVGAAHAHGIIHRDLKPANLFRARQPDGSFVTKVIDFGVAKATAIDESSLTGTGAAMGSPLYMSPEQLRQDDLDVRTDIWALGITLYELLVGVTPFESEVPALVMAGIFTQPPVPMRDDRPDVSEALEAVIFRCLEKDREARFASVHALREALDPFLLR